MGSKSEVVAVVPKIRKRAQGVPKVKTGCQTCKTRRKKCDEKKPSCTPCILQNWPCDFPTLALTPHLLLPSPTPNPHPNPNPAPPLQPIETHHLEFFHHISSQEFTLLFNIPSFQQIILQSLVNEKFMVHAGLAIGALSRCHYRPFEIAGHGHGKGGREEVEGYALRQYNTAIRALRERLDGRGEGSWEVALLGSVVFICIEGLFEHEDRVEGLLGCAFGVLEGRGGRIGNRELVAGSWWDGCGGSPDLGYLVSALRQIAEQQSAWATLRSSKL